MYCREILLKVALNTITMYYSVAQVCCIISESPSMPTEISTTRSGKVPSVENPELSRSEWNPWGFAGNFTFLSHPWFGRYMDYDLAARGAFHPNYNLTPDCSFYSPMNLIKANNSSSTSLDDESSNS